MKFRKLILLGMSLITLPAFAHADDCRNSTTENCFFTAAAVILNATDRLPMGELYFKSIDGYAPPDRKTLVLVLPNGQSSIYLYDRVTKEISPEIARITTAPNAHGQAFTMELSPNVTVTDKGAHDETYTYCRTGSFGAAIVTSLKTVKEISLTRNDGSPVMGTMKSVKLTSESNFRELPNARPVTACP